VADAGQVAQPLARQQLPAELELQVGDHGREIGVAGALPVAVHGALHVHDPSLDGGDGVGDGAARVVVAVDAEIDADLTGGRDDITHPARQHAPVGVAEHDDLGARLGGRSHDLERVTGVAPVAVEEVFAVDEHPASFAHQVADGVAHHREVLGQARLQRALDVSVVALRHQADDGRPGIQQGRGERVGGGLAPDPPRGAEGHQLGSGQRQVGASPGKEGGVVGVGTGPTPFDEGDAEFVEVGGDPQLVGDAESQPLLLSAVAQGGVEDLESLRRWR